MKNLEKIINHFDGELYDLCYYLLEQCDNEIEVFKYTCENLLELPKDKSIKINKFFDYNEISEYASLYEDIVKGIMKTTIKKCDYGVIRYEEFYKVLWESYVVNLSTKKEKAYAFFRTIIDKKIPYVYLGKPLSMDNDKFMKLNIENQDIIKKIDYIFDSPYEQKTEKASLVLHALDSIDEYNTKVIALVRAFTLEGIKRIEGKSSVSIEEIEDIIKRIDVKIEDLQGEEHDEEQAESKKGEIK